MWKKLVTLFSRKIEKPVQEPAQPVYCYQLKLPFDIDCIIPDNDSVRLLSQFVEEMDLTELYSTYFRIRQLVS